MMKNPQKKQKATFETISPYDCIESVYHGERRTLNLWLSTADDLSWSNSIYRRLAPSRVSPKHRETFNVIMCNLVAANKPIGILLDKTGYKNKKLPENFSPKNVSPICNDLMRQGYITLDRGYRYAGKNQNGVSSIIQPTEKFLSIAPRDTKIVISKEGVIKCKGFDLNGVKYAHIERTREILDRYNHTVEPANQLYAVYNNSPYLGGRITGSEVIFMRKEERKDILIEGESVFEADIKSCLPFLLYANELGEEIPEDAYSIDGVPRNLSKKGFLMMLNSEEKKGAIGALRKTINFEYSGQYQPEHIVSMIEKKHKRISDYFFTGIGLRMMNLEAQCMCAFMAEMLAKEVKVYPVYDSVVGRLAEREQILESFSAAFTVNGVSPVVH